VVAGDDAGNTVAAGRLRAVVGDHDTDCEPFDTVNVTSVKPAT